MNYFKRISFLLLLSLAPFLAFSQNNTCLQDLEGLLHQLQQTPSYKDQIRGKGEYTFLEYYEKLKVDAANAATKGECFLALGNLVAPIRDNHLFLSEIPEITISQEQLGDSVFVQGYRQSDAYRNFSTVKMNLDSLEAKLGELPKSSKEGIYHYQDYAKIALFKLTDDQYIAAILETKLPHWQRGQIAFLAKEYDGGKWNVWNYNLITKSLQFITADRIENGAFNRIAWTKFPDRKDYIQIDPGAPTFDFQTLNEATQYLRLGTFATGNRSLEESQAFFEGMKDSITAPHLIVDLRNNGGGGSKASRKFYQLLREETKNRKIWVLINQKTASNAEQFTIEVSKLDNLTTLGNTTAGILTYGNNRGSSVTLPSGVFKLYITDMKDSGGYLPYESVGVKPEIFLSIEQNWIAQTLALISEAGH